MAQLLIVTLAGTSILRYIGTFDAKVGSGLVYDSSPPSRGKLLRSHTTIDTSLIRSNRNAGCNIFCMVGRRWPMVWAGNRVWVWSGTFCGSTGPRLVSFSRV